MYNNLDLNQLREEFEKAKDLKDMRDYQREIDENNEILYSEPFRTDAAQQQIAKLVNKYCKELNLLSIIYGNNMKTTSQPLEKTQQQLWYELNYINDNIPFLALEKEGFSSILKSIETQIKNMSKLG